MAEPKRPAGQTCAVALVEPAGHQCPRAHAPSQAAVARPSLLPYTPGGQAKGVTVPLGQ